MRIYLQSPVSETGIIRFVHIILQEDLMGGWSVIIERGQQGSPGSVKKHYFENRQEAIDAAINLRDKDIRRGYSIAFVQGDAPDV